MFSLSLVISFGVFICGKICIFHYVIHWNEVIDLQYRFPKGNERAICFFAGGSRFLFENFWKFGIGKVRQVFDQNTCFLIPAEIGFYHIRDFNFPWKSIFIWIAILNSRNF